MSLFDRNLNGFRALRPSYTRKRIGYLGRYNADGNIDPDPRSDLPADYIWVRFDADRGGTRVKNLRVRAEWGTPVWVEFNELTREDEVREVHSLLAPQAFGGAIAAALNVPALPAGVSTPTTARDIIPGGLFADASGGLSMRIMPTWTPFGTWWSGDTLIELVPTATASSRSFAIIGITSVGEVGTTLTTDRGLTYPLVDGDGYLTADGSADIKTVMDANPEVWWVAAVLLTNGMTEVDSTRIYDLRFWQMPTMTGADGADAGAVGFVPAPAATDNTKALFGNGTWQAALKADGTVAMAAALNLNGFDLNAVNWLNFDDSSELTINAGAITATQTFHRVDTEADTAADDLDTINGGSDGRILILRAEHTNRSVVIKHNTGNIQTYSGADVTLNETYMPVLLIYDGTLTKWLAFGGGGAGSPAASYYQTVQYNGSDQPQRTKLDFIPGTNITIGVVDDAGNNRTRLTFNASSTIGTTTPAARVSKWALFR